MGRLLARRIDQDHMTEAENTPSRRTRRSAVETPYTLSMGVVAGIPIRLHYSFLLVLAWIAFVSSGPDRLMGVLTVIGIFTCIVLHELGHSLVAQRYGIEVSEIVLYPIGGVARMQKLPAPHAELWIALAGPAVNVVIASILYAALHFSGGLAPWDQVWLTPGHFWQKILYSNALLIGFNMIPAFPMDGGRVLRALLALGLGETRATEIAAYIGQVLALVMGLVGIWSGFNIVLVLIAIFIFMAAGQEAAMYRGKAFLEGLLARDGMITELKTLTVGETLGDAQELLLHTSQTDFPVLHGEEVVGLLSRISLFQNLRDKGADEYVAGAMERDFPTASPDDDLQELAADMQSNQTSCVIVMQEGRLLGMVTMENLAELLILRQIMQRSAVTRGA
jgi:Zn-dependent protease/CBS domain-containing protein